MVCTGKLLKNSFMLIGLLFLNSVHLQDQTHDFKYLLDEDSIEPQTQNSMVHTTNIRQPTIKCRYN